jgi:MFS family permease
LAFSSQPVPPVASWGHLQLPGSQRSSGKGLHFSVQSWCLLSGSILGGALVLALEPIAGREWALRVPFLAAAAASVLLYFYALPRLNSEKIEEATQLSSGSGDSIASVTGDS